METLHVAKTPVAPGEYKFSDLVDEYGDLLYRFCRSLTYSREDAEDLFQETFSKAFELLPKLAAAESAQGFLFSTALYIWKDWRRKYARRKRLAPMEPLGDLVSSEETEKEIVEQEQRRIVGGLIDTLPPKFRIPLILYYTVEMSVSEIASVLKIPAGTVKSRLFKARKMIKKGLEAIHYDYGK